MDVLDHSTCHNFRLTRLASLSASGALMLICPAAILLLKRPCRIDLVPMMAVKWYISAREKRNSEIAKRYLQTTEPVDPLNGCDSSRITYVLFMRRAYEKRRSSVRL
jgi:hypothetical protein